MNQRLVESESEYHRIKDSKDSSGIYMLHERKVTSVLRYAFYRLEKHNPLSNPSIPNVHHVPESHAALSLFIYSIIQSYIFNLLKSL